MEKRYLTEAIGNEYKNWYTDLPHRPILISAGTGRGKTFFILKTLLPYCAECGKRMLYMVNRLALKAQIEKEITELPEDVRKAVTVATYQSYSIWRNEADTIVDKYGQYVFDCFRKMAKNDSNEFSALINKDNFVNQILAHSKKISSGKLKWKSLTVYYNEESLSYYPYIQCVFSYTKSSVFGKLKKKAEYDEIAKYHCVVFDEIHFLLQDSLFNFAAYEMFRQLTEHSLTKGVTVFMTATPTHVITLLDKIYFSGNTDLHFLQPGIFLRQYQIKPDYSYIRPHILLSDTELVKRIISTGNEKWLIFVDNIDRGKKLEKMINSEYNVVECPYKTPCRFLYRSADANKMIRLMQKKGALNDLKCLIATSILDNGVDIKDKMFKHLAVITWDSTEFVQMVGRKRIEDPETDTLDLYLVERSRKSIITFFQKLEERYKVLNDILEGANNKDDNKRDVNVQAHFVAKYCNRPETFKKLQGLVRFTNEGYDINWIAMYKTNLMLWEYSNLLNGRFGNGSLEKYQLSLLELDSVVEKQNFYATLNGIIEGYKCRDLNVDDIRLLKKQMEEMINNLGMKGKFTVMKRRGASPTETPNRWFISLNICCQVVLDEHKNAHKGKRVYRIKEVTDQEYMNLYKKYRAESGETGVNVIVK